MDEKSRLREQMKGLRDAVSLPERQAKSEAIAEILLSLPEYAGNDTFLVYSAIWSEVSTASFVKQALSGGKRIFFPRVMGEHMEFYRVTRLSQLERGSFSVMEPRLFGPKPGRSVKDREDFAGEMWDGDSGAVLVPGVAFSKEGGRIGYGGGYYDRYLRTHPQLTAIGVCFSLQLAADDALGLFAHDRRMDKIVTENGVHERII